MDVVRKLFRQEAVLSAIILWSLLIIGCGDESPSIRYGHLACDECHMIISEAVFSAALRTENGEDLFFDDIGCLFSTLSKGVKPARVWIHDYPSHHWIPAESAFFSISSHLKTPMAYGVVGFQSELDARERSRGWNGRVYDFNELLTQSDLFLKRKGIQHANESAIS